MKPDISVIRARLESIANSAEGAAVATHLIPKLCDRVEELEAAIRTHGQCFTACARCGHETPNRDDDVCLVLANADSRADPAPGTTNGTKGDPCP